VVDNTISSAILIIAVVISTAAVINAVYPAMFGAIGSIGSTSSDASIRSGTSIDIMSCHFSADYSSLTLWAKNVGDGTVSESDLSGARMYYGNDTGSMTNYPATYAIQEPGDGDAHWDPGETLEIGLSAAETMPHNAGTHKLRLVLPGGATGEYTFRI
jgi:archaellum component FlaG (FlaF/FlaG flagellin family)